MDRAFEFFSPRLRISSLRERGNSDGGQTGLVGCRFGVEFNVGSIIRFDDDPPAYPRPCPPRFAWTVNSHDLLRTVPIINENRVLQLLLLIYLGLPPVSFVPNRTLFSPYLLPFLSSSTQPVIRPSNQTIFLHIHNRHHVIDCRAQDPRHGYLPAAHWPVSASYYSFSVELTRTDPVPFQLH